MKCNVGSSSSDDSEMDSPLYAAWFAGSNDIEGHPVLRVIVPDSDEVISTPVNSATNTSDPGASNVDTFRIPSNHVSAASSILAKCAADAKFIPSTTLDIPPVVFGDYVARISTFPGWNLTLTDKFEDTIEENNVDLMISQLQAAYEGAAVMDVQKIIDSVKDMVDSINHKSSKNTTLTKFLQGSIYNPKEDTNNVNVLLYYTNFVLSERVSGKKKVMTQSYVIAKVRYTINTKSLVDNAESLARNIIKKNYDDCFDSMSSPTGGASAANCSRKK